MLYAISVVRMYVCYVYIKRSINQSNLGLMRKILCTDYSSKICTELNCNEPNFILLQRCNADAV